MDAEARYSRQLRFAPIGREGQRRLGAAVVLIVGVGALGASLAQHLVRAGVGSVRLADRDYVELSNLQRQTLFDEDDARASLPKAVAAARRLQAINSAVRVEPHVLDVHAGSLDPLLAGVQLVLDGTDNAQTRLLLSEACYRRGLPLVYGGVAGSGGMSALLEPGRTACLRCLIGADAPESPDGLTCESLGVIGPAVEFTAALQAAEALKWLAGDAAALRRTLVAFELWPFGLRELALPEPADDCPVCGGGGCSAVAAPVERRYTGMAEAGGPAARTAEQRAPTARLAGHPVGHGERAESEERVAKRRDARSAPRGETTVRSDGQPGQTQATVLCGRDTVQVTLGVPLALREWGERLVARGLEVAANPYLVRAELKDGRRLVLFGDGRVLVQGTADAQEALALCGKFVDPETAGAAAQGGGRRTTI
ncbi:ThiF family adenylyltransferase [Paenibacillus sp. IB182496]|uniref:ThiF family adenylyltransferase n=2 Tax=Paenibacillus sabuli TaxID=2772509 RepID=A0A927BWK0_9BACL|nr:ThiF family adenylyltransferase [Paenibacillus sabuli]